MTQAEGSTKKATPKSKAGTSAAKGTAKSKTKQTAKSTSQTKSAPLKSPKATKEKTESTKAKSTTKAPEPKTTAAKAAAVKQKPSTAPAATPAAKTKTAEARKPAARKKAAPEPIIGTEATLFETVAQAVEAAATTKIPETKAAPKRKKTTKTTAAPAAEPVSEPAEQTLFEEPVAQSPFGKPQKAEQPATTAFVSAGKREEKKPSAAKIKAEEELVRSQASFAEKAQEPATKISEAAALELPETKIELTEKEKPEFSALLKIGIDDALVEQLVKLNLGVPSAVSPANLLHAIGGGDLFITGRSGDDKFIVPLLVAGQRILQKNINRGTANAPAVLFLASSDSVANQLLSRTRNFVSPLGIKVFALFSETDADRAARGLASGPDILIVTPESHTALIEKNQLSFENVGLIVCENLDEWIVSESGHQKLVDESKKSQKIFLCPVGKDKAKDFAFLNMEEPKQVDVDALDWCQTNKDSQYVYAIPAVEKFNVLMASLKTRKSPIAVVFANTQVVAEWVAYKLVRNGYRVDVLSHRLHTGKRGQVAAKIRNREIDVLVATDIINDVLIVGGIRDIYNFDVPEIPENYLARAGRISRETRDASVITLVCEDYGYHMGAVATMLGLSPEVRAVLPEAAQMEDKSDFPFDSQGRVKPIWTGEEFPVAAEAPQPAARPFEERERFRPEREVRERPFQGASAEKPAAAARPFAAPTAPAAAPGQPKPFRAPLGKEQVAGAKPKQAPRPAATGPTGRPPFTEQARTPRRDEKAKETIERALAAARAAAERKAGFGKKAEAPQTQEEGLVALAKEGLETAITIVQDRVATELEKRFPTIAGLFKQIGVLGKKKEEGKKPKK